MPGNDAGERERPGGEIRRFRRGRPRRSWLELVALRAILLNVLFKLANGEKPTAEEMQRLIDRADSDKLKKARERLAQAAESEGQPEEKS